MEISILRPKNEADRFLQIDGKPRTLREVSSGIGQDIGPYSKVLGLLDAEGKIEPVDQRRQWNPERGEYDRTCERVRSKPKHFELVPGEPLD
jgi:hypothetical protein